MIKKTALIIPAAGNSKRMKGAIKQLLPWKSTTLLGQAIEQAQASEIDEIYVVLGAESNKIKEHIQQYNIEILINPDWEKGMGTSISHAVNVIQKKNKKIDAVMIHLPDQPQITHKELNMLIKTFQDTNKNIVATRLKNKNGVPAIISKKYFKELSVLQEDYGARYLINNLPQDTKAIDLPVIYYDIDSREDYKRVLGK